jgi:hypothetical protein
MKTALAESVRPQGKHLLAEIHAEECNIPQDLVDVDEPSMAKVVSKHFKVIYRTPVLPGILLGTWVNVNPTTLGLVKVVMRLAGSQFIVHPYGAGHPTPCTWGGRVGIAYADKVSANQPCAFTVIFPTSFKETILTGHLRNGLLVVEAFHRFTDGSGRMDYYSREIFRRA